MTTTDTWISCDDCDWVYPVDEGPCPICGFCPGCRRGPQVSWEPQQHVPADRPRPTCRDCRSRDASDAAAGINRRRIVEAGDVARERRNFGARRRIRDKEVLLAILAGSFATLPTLLIPGLNNPLFAMALLGPGSVATIIVSWYLIRGFYRGDLDRPAVEVRFPERLDDREYQELLARLEIELAVPWPDRRQFIYVSDDAERGLTVRIRPMTKERRLLLGVPSRELDPRAASMLQNAKIRPADHEVVFFCFPRRLERHLVSLERDYAFGDLTSVRRTVFALRPGIEGSINDGEWTVVEQHRDDLLPGGGGLVEGGNRGESRQDLGRDFRMASRRPSGLPSRREG